MDRKAKTAAKPESCTPPPSAAPEMHSVQDSEAFKQQGNDYFRSGNFAEAVKSYTQAIEVSQQNPQNYIYYCNRATAYFYLKDYESAEAGEHPRSASRVDCKESLALNPRYMKAYTRLTSVYSKLGRYEDAVRACEAGLVIDPSNPDLSSLLPSLKQHLTSQSSEPQQGQQGQQGQQPSLGNLFQSMASNPMVQSLAQNLSNGSASFSDIMNNPYVSELFG